MPAPEPELGAKPKPGAKPAKPKVQEEELKLELAVDPRELVAQRSREASGARLQAPGVGAPPPPQPQPPMPLARVEARSPQPGARSRVPLAPAGASDLDTDALVLADYGAAPRSWIFSPMYAWRVLKRQRELKAGLAVRKAEADHAQSALEDALVGLAERARPLAEKSAEYVQALGQVSHADDVLRSRDRVLAAEQDAQKSRLSQVDARIGKTEGDLAAAQSNERSVAGELASAQGALARAEAKLKKAEGELKSVLQAIEKRGRSAGEGRSGGTP
jgi:hypothetical protein